MSAPVDIRLRSWISDDELAAKKGKVIGDADYNLVATGSVRVFSPKGPLLAVRLSGVLADLMATHWETLSGIRFLTKNRGMASGAPRTRLGDQKWTWAKQVYSRVIGSIDPGRAKDQFTDKMAGFRIPVCRLTSWTADNLTQWQDLTPLFQEIGRHLFEQNRARYDAQIAVARRTHPDWVIPGTPFTTVTINNTYSTGVHVDAGDLPEGWSTLAVARRGEFTGGYLVLPRYRLAFDMRDGDLLMFDAHEWHGNTPMLCPHSDGPLDRPCPEGCERVSLVTYYRTRMADCGSNAEEIDKAMRGVAVGR